MWLNYLKTSVEYKKAERPIIHLDETYVRSTNTTTKAWTDVQGLGFKIPVSKGRGLIIVHGCKRKWVCPKCTSYV